MSWSSPLRVLGVCGVWLALQTGCGGNPTVSNPDEGTNGGSATGGTGTSGSGGSLMIGIGGEGDSPGEAGAGATPSGTYVCGNQELEPGEFCDDGNTEDDDGCSADCQEVDSDYDCSTVGEPCEKVVICGNGVLEGREECDDGNTEDDDGCAADCGAVESGWVCVRPGKECVKLSVCGNGQRERGEQCDEGDAPPSGGCSELCQIEPGYYCQFPGQACVKQVCGDKVRTPNEACDDGNVTAGDGCSADCAAVETGWHCNALGCKPQCGDGLRVKTESCDDGNAIGGDGCSSACKVEPFFACDDKSPSQCAPTTKCSNGVLEPIFQLVGGVYKAVGHEVCDPPSAATGCNAGCTSVSVVVTPATCGDSVIEGTETCDPSDGVACKACKVQPGYTCPQANYCFANPKCGDGIVNPGEACDDKNPVNGDGCSAACAVESGYTCVGLGPSQCVKPVCGNGAAEPGESCDDGNANGADGCNACKITPGWACPAPGAPCITKCGDGIKLGLEQCDDANTVSGDGCNAGCKVEPGFKCTTAGQKCVAAVCGDKSVDVGEGCDDGNKVAADGCGPTCQPEPTVTVGPAPTVNVFCGDGLKTGAEECDDGNTDDADGCDATCKIPSGWKCTSKLTLPSSIEMQVQYRDFKRRQADPGGHPDFEWNIESAQGIPGAVCKRGSTQCTAAAGAACAAGSCGYLDAQGKPAFHLNAGDADITNKDTYSLWYRDANPGGIQGQHGTIEVSPLAGTLVLNQIGGATSETYQYDNSAFWPLTGKGFGNDGNTKNFHFTTELRYFFQYKGGETLTFRGDDDVWVFINGRHAVDIGGVHGAQWGRVVLGDDGGAGATDSNCTANGGAEPGACTLEANEVSSNDDQRFGLVKGGVYEIAFFQAERHTSESNFRLTLAGFLAPRSFCEPICGDGVIVGNEFCDDGANNSSTASGACNTSCTARAFCGDGVRQLPGEACDNGTNTDLYKTSTSGTNLCAPGCKLPASCGDGALQAGQGEQCDKGGQNNDAAYGPSECKTNCKLGGYCGDGVPQTSEGELCDLGGNNGKTYGSSSCGYDCKPGRRCGDGIINDESESCDDGAMNGAINSHCSTSCTVVPYCGDGETKSPEECDYGQFATTPPEYGGCSTMCTWGPRCGDGETDPEEECDEGASNNSSTYDGCTLACTLGPRCGDGVTQASQGEACDNGFNEDDYDDPTTPQAECGLGCKPPPFCGDKKVQSAHEDCDEGTANDDDAYEGCTSECKYGPYCGDGELDDKELCDDGAQNVNYSSKPGGCGYDCTPAPYCGDGERNGSEQCDLGAKKNTGDYGTCNRDCTFAPRCGDKNVDAGEECDDGPTGSLSCLPSCKRRPVVQ